MRSRCERRGGYLAVDALVALTVGTVAVSAAVVLAGDVAARVARAQDRLISARIAEQLYEDLHSGAATDASATGLSDGRQWRYVITPDGSDAEPSLARRAAIEVERRRHPPLRIEAVLPPAPATASSN